MANTHFSSKRVQINKSQATIVGVVAGAVFIAVFSLVSSKALWTQRGYQARVIDKKQTADQQLDENLASVTTLATSYKAFVSQPVNMLGGNPSGSGEKDGDNARLVLDALPSKYDFPALTSSLEKILTDKGFKIEGITGTDDEIAQSSAKQTGTPSPVDMPFQLNVSGSYQSIQDLVSVFERSIRPIVVQKVSISGGAGNMKMQVEAKTFYQPEKTLSIKQEAVN